MNANSLMPEARTALLQELRDEGIESEAILDAIAAVPRECFVPPELRERAYENRALAIGLGQTISQPYIVALMTQSLALTGNERILEIGTGSGYQTAILARLAHSVYTIERIAPLATRAREVLENLGVDNVFYRVGDGCQGWPEEAPFDRILVTAVGRHVVPTLWEQLDELGLMVMPVGADDQQALYAFQKRSGRMVRNFLCQCRFVPLIENTNGAP